MSNSHEHTKLPNICNFTNYLRSFEDIELGPANKKDLLLNNYYYLLSAQINGTKCIISYSDEFGITIIYPTPECIFDRRNLHKLKHMITLWPELKNTSEIAFYTEHTVSNCHYVNYALGTKNFMAAVDEKLKIHFIANSEKVYALYTK